MSWYNLTSPPPSTSDLPPSTSDPLRPRCPPPSPFRPRRLPPSVAIPLTDVRPPPATTSKHTCSMLAQLCGTSHRTNSGSSVVVARLVGLTSDQGKHARTWFPHRVYGPFLIRLICLIPFSLAIAGNYVFVFNSFSPHCPPVIYSRT